ncbi:MAG TPA: BMP family ABC transporter substrate-binding protein [Gaiellaceae bacterium]|nr:BMP family ABC transporter substrate-binding protein [Gaiellaceae bacterium]
MTDSKKLFRRYRLPLGAAAAVVLAATAFGGASSSAAPKVAVTCSSPSGASGPGTGATTIGFIYVGSKTDFGYNEAAHAGAVALGKACPNIKILEADSIPETSDMTTAAEQMIGQGAKIIFSTSYGYKDYAVSLAKEHSDVAVLQQGNFITPPVPPNANTYFGNVYETVYLAGIAAGKATKTGKLGFVAAFPIPQTLLNINAFELGAQSVNPKVKTYTVFTGSWCDPGKQADAASSLLSEGADVLTQHQDCTGTVIKAAEAKGAFSVGYHYDAQSLAPKGWLTGSDWNWGPLYESMVSTILNGKFTGSVFNTNYSLGFSSKTIPSPMDLAPYGPSVKAGTKALIATAKKKILAGWSPFTGPIVDQSGKIEVAKGKAATAAQLAGMGYLVKGVVGSIPK